MTEIRAFVGHSFTSDDSQVVRSFLDYFDVISSLVPQFSWMHAEAAEPKQLAEKVLSLMSDRNVFIGICTKKEYVVDPKDLKPRYLSAGFRIEQSAPTWKTSDWIIQEIGLAIGKQLDLILLIEKGLREPGGLQSNIEYIPFDRANPEQSFAKVLEMIRALLPKSVSVSEAATLETIPTSGVQQPQPEKSIEDVFRVPQPDWDRVHYEIGFMRALAEGDRDTAAKIEEAYLASDHATESNNRPTWRAFAEYRRILSGSGGALVTLQAVAKENPSCSEIAEFLALAYRHYGDDRKAADAYETAAAVAGDSGESVRLMGQAAAAYFRNGQTVAAHNLLCEMRGAVAATGTGEPQLLRALRTIAEANNDAETEIALLERLNEIDPSDISSRFSLAYKHSEHGNNDLCLYHYSKIPARERSSSTWNNLGVVRDQLSMPVRSVSAYRRAEEMGETLVMSNLALKFLGAGFLKEAEQECDAALAKPYYHKNIPSTLMRLKAAPDAEEKTEKEKLKDAEPKSEFYRQLGRAIASPQPDSLEAQWQGPDCELQVSVASDKFEATGSYERQSNTLATALTSLFKSPTEPERYRVNYHGTIRGRAIQARVTRIREGDPPKQTSLLSASEQEPRVLMLIADDEAEIRAMEIPQSGKPRFYALTPVHPGQQTS